MENKSEKNGQGGTQKEENKRWNEESQKISQKI